MPYAAKGKIAFEERAFDEFEEFIEISEAQYMEALEGMQSGLEVTIDGGFKVSPPAPPPPPPEPTPEEIAQQALAARDQLLAVAAIRMGPLQDAVEEGDATAEEVVTLKLWRQYRIALNRIEQQAGFPLQLSWPLSPDTAGDD